MAEEIVMPKLTDTMEEGKVLRWLKKEGDYIRKGEIIAEVETDKAEMEMEAFSSGTVLKILAGEGQTLPVGQTIAIVGEAGERVEEKPREAVREKAKVAEAPAREVPAREAPPRMVGAPAPIPAWPKVIKASPAARRLAQEKGADLSRIEGTGPEGRILTTDIERYLAAATEAPKKEASATAVARALAEAKKVKLEEIEGTGIGGKITKEDVEARIHEREEVAPAAAGERIVELSKMRQTIARRMAESKTTIPHFYTTVEIIMDEVVKLRERLTKTPGQEEVTFNDIVLKATALALRKNPEVNASYSEQGIILKGEINVGMAVAVEGGLIVPVIANCDGLSLGVISTKSRELREKAEAGRFSPGELLGGTFTVSNMGMLQVENFLAIINPPQAAILAVSTIKDEPVVRGGKVVVAKVMKATLSADHRVLDGVKAAIFLRDLRNLLEEPQSLLQ
jgi:pyruvate dehydrogenase E2 component (dihydrolipoamide acetyltransferase)